MARRKSSRRKSSSREPMLTKALSHKGAVCSSCGSNPCCCHSKGLGWVLLILGVLFLLRDMNVFTWWNINWWTVLLILGGIWMIRK